MEVYVLDTLLRRIAVIDWFESCIWTERYSAFGDFEMVIESTNETRNMLKTDTRLATNESYYVMTIENVEDTIDQEGKQMLKVSGRSLEYILDNRVATDGFVGTTSNPNWAITDTPAGICRQVFQKICVDGFISSADIIPFYKPGNILPANTIPEPSTQITLELEVDSVYNTIKKICDVYDLGFRLIRNFDKSELYFNVYTGDDRTTFQTVNPPVIFSQAFNNVKDTKEFRSVENYKNVAYVFSKNGAEMVYPNGVDPATSGFDRRVLTVKADDIDLPAGAALTAALVQKGQEALADHRSLTAFDGQITDYSSYKYGTEYRLGDLVELRGSDGAANKMRVTEHIFVSDAQGDRSYPTLATELFISAGSWLSFDIVRTWDDMADTTWDDLS